MAAGFKGMPSRKEVLKNDYSTEVGLRKFPASTCVEARICREELMVEMEMPAVVNDGH